MKTLLNVLQLLPVLISVIRSLEDALPISGQGKAKMDIILGAVDATYELSKDVQKDMPKEQVVSVLGKLAGMVVSTFNSLGVFKKAPAA